MAVRGDLGLRLRIELVYGRPRPAPEWREYTIDEAGDERVTRYDHLVAGTDPSPRAVKNAISRS